MQEKICKVKTTGKLRENIHNVSQRTNIYNISKTLKNSGMNTKNIKIGKIFDLNFHVNTGVFTKKYKPQIHEHI